MNSVAALDPKIALHALSQTASAIVFLDEEKRVVFHNEAAAKILGFQGVSTVGATVDSIFPTSSLVEFNNYLDKYRGPLTDLSPTEFSRDFEVTRHDGSTFWANATFSRIVYDSHVYFTILVRDVTKRQKIESDLASKNEQINKLTAQIEKFLYSTSHDLRSPLTSILGLVNLMRMESLDDSFEEYTAKIEASAMKLDGIIKNIMSFSKATYQRRKSQKIDLELLAHRVLNAHHSDANYKKIFFEVVANSQYPFYSDPERMEIILNNIISNAIHFYDPNKVRSFVRININVSAVDVLIEIIDNGLGIGHQHHNQIFSMFYKATLNSSGAGLGLYIVKESLEQLKGSVKMESELGFGSVFRVRVPNDHKGQLISRKLKLQHN
ncbi:sensor histidine kinase [Pseudochryseolinea flava]|nr:PAS domain-containing sensor histidine kinase [Pseudochryseolinea flava]